MIATANHSKAAGTDKNTQVALSNTLATKGTANAHAAGTFLFSAGESPRGVHVVRKGRIKLTMDSADGKTLTFKVAKPGDVLDLGASVLGRPHEVTAEALEQSETQFIPQQEFMRLIQKDGQLCLQVALTLGHDFHEACVELTMLGLSRSAESKLASMLLRMMQEAGGRTALVLDSTHEELAQVIGTSRETVTRVLARLRRTDVIEVHGSKLTLHDVAALRRIENMEDSCAQMGKMPLASTSRMHAAYAAY